MNEGGRDSLLHAVDDRCQLGVEVTAEGEEQPYHKGNQQQEQ